MQKREKPAVYLAAPLFSDAERTFNTQLADALAPFVNVYLPQRDGGLLVELVAGGSEVGVASRAIFQRDLQAMRDCDLLLMVLDGRAVDEGACFELGYAFAIGKRAIGIQTDPRRLLPLGNNPMISSALDRVFTSVEGVVQYFEEIARKTQRIQ